MEATNPIAVLVYCLFILITEKKYSWYHFDKRADNIEL